MLLQFGNRQLAPTLLADHASPLVSLADGPLRAAGQLFHWRPEADRPLRALVNALGAGGSCGHVVLRAPEPREPEGRDPRHERCPPRGRRRCGAPVGRAARAARGRGRAAARPARRGPASVPGTGAGRPGLHHPVRPGAAALPAGGHRPGPGHPEGRPGRVHRRPAGPPELATGTADPGTSGPGQAASPVGRQRAGCTAPRSTGRGSGRRDRPGAYRCPATPLPRIDMALAGRRQPLPFLLPLAVASADHLGYLIRIYAEESGIEPDRLHPRIPLENYGLTSALIAALNARLSKTSASTSPGHCSSSTQTWPGSPPRSPGWTPGRAADDAGRDRRPSAGGCPTQPPPAPGAGQRIAIIGLAGRYPQAADLDEFWCEPARRARQRLPAPPGTAAARLARLARRADGRRVHRRRGRLRPAVLRDHSARGRPDGPAGTAVPRGRVARAGKRGLPEGRLAAYDGPVGVFVGSMYNEYPLFGVAAARDGRWTATGSAPPVSPTECPTSWGCTAPA